MLQQLKRRKSELRTFSIFMLVQFCTISTTAIPVGKLESNDQIVLAPIGKETLIIDTKTEFRVGAELKRRTRNRKRLVNGWIFDRIEMPVERISIRLIDENSTTPLLIDIQKVETAEEQRIEQGERMEDAFPYIPNSQEEGSGELLTTSEESSITTTELAPPEECLENGHLLSMEIVRQLRHRKRRLLRLIRTLNQQQDTYCRLDKKSNSAYPLTPYRQCPLWREEKMVYYYKLMRLIYCSDYSKWPNAQRIKRNYGRYFPLLERLYAFME